MRMRPILGERRRRPPLAPVAPQQPRPARDAAHALSSAEAWSRVKAEFTKTLALRSPELGM